MKSMTKTMTSMHFQVRLANGPQVGVDGKFSFKGKRKRLGWGTQQKGRRYTSKTHQTLRLGERERAGQCWTASNTNKK